MNNIDVIHHFEELYLSLTDLFDSFVSVTLLELLYRHYVRQLDSKSKEIG